MGLSAASKKLLKRLRGEKPKGLMNRAYGKDLMTERHYTDSMLYLRKRRRERAYAKKRFGVRLKKD